MTNTEITQIGILIYPDCQLSSVHGLTDLFCVATYWAFKETEVPIRVTHWKMNEQGEIVCIWSSDSRESGILDYVITPPSIHWPWTMPKLENESHWLSRMHHDGSRICSVCAGAFVLAGTGILDDRQITTHWAFADLLANTFPNIDVKVDDLIVDDGDVISAGGMLSWIDLGLMLVERLLGTKTMLETARFLVTDPPRNSQKPFMEFVPKYNHGDELVLKIQHHIDKNLSEPINIESLASLASLSSRTLSRRFQKATSMSISEYMKQLKVHRAQARLEQSRDTVEKISWDLGYKDVSSFRRLFKSITGVSPSQYRHGF